MTIANTNELELADRVVAILGWHPDIRKQPGYIGAEQFLNDWRVAGALMEQCLQKLGSIGFLALTLHGFHRAVKESLPRAIIEACVEALDD